MKKRINYVVLSLVVIFAASCTFAVYVQKNNTDSTQKVENPTSASADSASITISTIRKNCLSFCCIVESISAGLMVRMYL